jgi:hypothetical protein
MFVDDSAKLQRLNVKPTQPARSILPMLIVSEFGGSTNWQFKSARLAEPNSVTELSESSY